MAATKKHSLEQIVANPRDHEKLQGLVSGTHVGRWIGYPEGR
jgi:hypothetical protein